MNKIELIQKGRVLLTPTRSVLIENIWWAWEKLKCKGLEVRAAELAQWAEGAVDIVRIICNLSLVVLY